jgi:dTDP-4-dehydrorhamnose reductase
VRILVTGTSGQVGSAVCRRFADLATVLPTDRSTLDLSRPETIGQHLDALRPECIINAGAYTAVDRAEDERELAFVVNAAAPGALSRWAASHHVPMVHFSTDYVFDGSGQAPWREHDPLRPINAYGASKAAGEEAVRASGAAHLILRTSWVYAATGINFLQTIVRLAREREELRVVADQNGAPTTAAYLADVLAEIFLAHQEGLSAAFAEAKNTVHVAADGYTSWHGFAEAIISGLKRRGVKLAAQRVIPISSRDYPTKAKRPLNSRLDLTRLRQTFKVAPRPWTELLEAELERLAAAQPS